MDEGAVCDQERLGQLLRDPLWELELLILGEAAWCVLHKVVSSVVRWSSAILGNRDLMSSGNRFTPTIRLGASDARQIVQRETRERGAERRGRMNIPLLLVLDPSVYDSPTHLMRTLEDKEDEIVVDTPT